MTTSQNDFAKGSVSRNILNMALPMTMAQFVSVLYNVVDRMYLGRLPGHLALTGVGLCLPLISILMGFANLLIDSNVCKVHTKAPMAGKAQKIRR